jgi:hypothetical protein
VANLDTKAKRFSGIYVMESWRGAMVVPTGTVDQNERQAAAYMYSGIHARNPNGTTKFLTLLGAGSCFATLLIVFLKGIR